MHPAYFPVFFWSTLIFISFLGYGEILRRRLNLREFDDIGWGLKAAWGMSIVLAIGGVLMALRIAIAQNLTFVVLFGAALACYYAAQSITTSPASKAKNKNAKAVSPPATFSFSAFHFSNVILYGLAALAFATSIAWPLQVDPNDDWIAYLMYPEKILQTGTLIDPFSLRRIAALGGQSLLQAVVMIVGEPENGHILDRGFGAIMLLGLMLEATQGGIKRWRFVRFLVIFAAITTVVPRIHTGSHLLGVTLLLALLITLARILEMKKWTFNAVLPVALVLMGVATLRPTFAIVGGGVVVVFLLFTAIQAPLGKRRDVVFSLLFVGSLTVLLLAPYFLVSWQSSGTLMFPFSIGYGNSEMMFGGTKEGGWTNLEAVIKFFAFPEIAVMICALLVSVALQGNQRRLGVVAALAGVGMVFLSAFKMSAASTYDVYRYTYPIIAFPLFWILARATSTVEKPHCLRGPIAAGGAALIIIIVQFQSISQEIQNEISTIPLQINGFKFPVAQLAPAYKYLQEKVPPGEKIFAIVDAPYLLNYARNPIDNIDSIGGASLPPAMPFYHGAEALKMYLISLGYRYVLCVDFDNAVLLYTRKLWENHPRKEWYFKEIWGKYALDFMRNMDSIADWNTIDRAGNTRLVHLVK